MIATGALPIQPDVPGAHARGIYGVSTLQSGIEIRQAIDREQPRRAVIIGGGYIGLEMAEALVSRGLEVALIDRSPQVMGTLDADMGALVSQALRNVGVTLYLEESLEGFEVDDQRVQAVVTDRRTLPADVVILGMGVKPNAALAEAAGIPLGELGAIRVDERMQTEIEGVWAAGDCVQSFHLVSRRPFHVALGTVANEQGRVAGINIGGGSATFPGVVGTAVSKICAVEVARTGLQEDGDPAPGMGIRQRHDQESHPRRLLSGGRGDDGEGAGRTGERPAPRRPDRRYRRAPPSASTCWPRRSTRDSPSRR